MSGEAAPSAQVTDRALRDALRHLDAAMTALTQTAGRTDVAAVMEVLTQARGRLAGVAADVALEGGVAVVPRMQLPPAAASAGAARTFCREQCEQWGLSA